MNRPFFQFLTWLSLLLLAGVIALWLRSYSAADYWACYDVSGRVATSSVRLHSAEIARGTLGFSRHVECSHGEPASDIIGTLGLEPNMTHQESLPSDPHALVGQANRHGFFFEQKIDSMSPGGFTSMSPGTTGWTTTICFPVWLTAGLLLTIPLLYAIGMWRRRRARRGGLCLNCGYDLRESRGQCPECGSSTIPRRPSPVRRIAPPCAALAALAIGILAGAWGIRQVQRRQAEAWVQGNSSRQLIAAIKAGDMNKFLAALDHGANPDALDIWVPYTDMQGETYFTSNGQAALGVALEARNRAMVRELVRRGADANARSYGPYYGPSPILAAVCAGDVESVRLLLDAGATPNVCDAQGRSICSTTRLFRTLRRCCNQRTSFQRKGAVKRLSCLHAGAYETSVLPIRRVDFGGGTGRGCGGMGTQLLRG
jgi:hypothetical protein